jgi:hypothetical protein
MGKVPLPAASLDQRTYAEDEVRAEMNILLGDDRARAWECIRERVLCLLRTTWTYSISFLEWDRVWFLIIILGMGNRELLTRSTMDKRLSESHTLVGLRKCHSIGPPVVSWEPRARLVFPSHHRIKRLRASGRPYWDVK